MKSKYLKVEAKDLREGCLIYIPDECRFFNIDAIDWGHPCEGFLTVHQEFFDEDIEVNDWFSEICFFEDDFVYLLVDVKGYFYNPSSKTYIQT